jgi:ubiquinone biosynthesis protein UbiJ
MSTSSPLEWLLAQSSQARAQWSAALSQAPKGLEGLAASLQPPAWLVQEIQQRGVLFLNHVLIQEPAAQTRLKRQQGRVVQLHWRDQVFRCRFTPAGLVELDAQGTSEPDLVLRATQDSPLDIAQSVMQGQKPGIRIEGDVQLAAEVNWLFDHVRWEPEEDLARLLGDAPAHAVMTGARKVASALREFVQSQQKATTP